MNIIRFILLKPFSIVYGVIVSLRNFLFDHGLKKSVVFHLPVICVGNITVGGTGKTPHVEYISSLLSESMSTAVLSRGYRRRSKGFRLVSMDDTADAAGDEPLQIARRLPDVRVAVDADRVEGIRKLTSMNDSPGVIVLDDAFQHRYVKAGLNILLTDYNRLMTHDHLLPYGRLRETVNGAKRAHVIIVTKTPPDISSTERERLTEEISPAPYQKIFFSTLEYGEFTPLFEGGKKSGVRSVTPSTNILLITGIANPAPLLSYLGSLNCQITHMAFSDHHQFSAKDINNIHKRWESIISDDKMIITTEKDSVRLKDFHNFTPPLRNEFYYIPIRIRFIEDGNEFNKIITDYAGKHS